MAQQLTNEDPAVLSLLAEALSRAADGQVTVPARDLIATVLLSNPHEPRALFLWGLAAFQDGNYKAAITRWKTLLSISTKEAPWLSVVRDNIKEAAKAGDILLSIIGTIGSPYVVKKNEKFGLSSSVSIIRPKEINSQYLYYCYVVY